MTEKYPWRFEVELGTKVYLIETEYPSFKESEAGVKNKYSIVEDEIVEIQDNSYHSKVDEDGCFTSEIERSEDWQNTTIGYWLKNSNCGHAYYFGDQLFLTREEAEEDLKEF